MIESAELAEREAGQEWLAAGIEAFGEWTDKTHCDQAAQYIADSHKRLLLGRGATHSGDCTSEPHTCQRCLYEDYMRQATAIRARKS